MKTTDAAQPDLIAALIEALEIGDDAAEAAVQTLAGRSDLLPALRPLLADNDADRRWWAVRALAVLGGSAAAAAAAEHLADPDEATRCASALALGQFRGAAHMDALAAALTDRSGWVRDSAADALAMIGEPALRALVAALTDPRAGVRLRAANAARKMVVSHLQGLRVSDFPAGYWPAINALRYSMTQRD